MKKPIRFLVCIVVIILTTYVYASDLTAQTKGDLSGADIRAVSGDTVWVILNHVKNDKSQQFEKFINEIFWPEAAKLKDNDKQIFMQTRVLHPVEMNEDGTYTYVFLMDPVIPNANYSILEFLKKMYDENKANEYFKMLQDCLAGPQSGYILKQSQY